MALLTIPPGVLVEPQLHLFHLPESIDMSNEPQPHAATVRLKYAVRDQIEFRVGTLSDLIPANHKVRHVVEYVGQLDMSNILGTINSVESGAGRPAIDPKILLSLWLYATLEGIISARTIADYCKEHIAFQWICGNVSVCHHTLSNFTAKYAEQLDEFLTQSIAILMKQGFVDLAEVAQDGLRVRASAGGSSFRREKTLKECCKEAAKYLKNLKQEFADNPAASRQRTKARALKEAKERDERVKEALEELKKLREEKVKIAKKSRHTPKQEELERIRASTTDPEARIMKMGDGGFRPAYNVQFATTTKHKIIVGVDVNNQGTDGELMCEMMTQVVNRCGQVSKKWLADAGYSTIEGIEEAAEVHTECKVYTPVKRRAKSTKDLYSPRPEDSEVIAEWRTRMGTEEAKEVYGRRGSAEFSNAQSRNHGLVQFLVRGLDKVKGIACLFALAHNMERFFSLQP